MRDLIGFLHGHLVSCVGISLAAMLLKPEERRYKSFWNLLGCDLYNEPHGELLSYRIYRTYFVGESTAVIVL